MFNTDFLPSALLTSEVSSQFSTLLYPQIIPWLLLFISIFSVFIKPKVAWFGIAITLISSFLLNSINLVGIGVIAVLFSLAFAANKNTHYWVKVILTSLVIILCIGLAAHLLPGFNNLLVLDKVNKSINSSDFTLYLNLDKPMILFALLLMVPTILQPNVKPYYCERVGIFQLCLLIVVGFIVIFTLASVIRLIQFEPNIPRWWWLFALNNLLLTCVIEEVFFRGVIQQKLATYFNPIAGLFIASILFGVAHFAGGLAYVLVATLAGVLYGFIYHVTGKITYAILGHFVLNFIHLSLFTYPLLK
ncbi:lysostaphin resistance A-like protein [Colwellia sp. RE-S-Sl-9]